MNPNHQSHSQLSSEDLLAIAQVAVQMQAAGLPADFAAEAMRFAQQWDGLGELMLLWRDAPKTDREEIEADIQEALDEFADAPHGVRKKPKIPFDDLDNVISSVHAHKKRIRDIVDRHGGVSVVARKMGVPQPSLSRMLNTASMPRRSTLYKLANALDLPETEIVSDWVI